MHSLVEMLRKEGLDHFHSFHDQGRTVSVSLVLKKPHLINGSLVSMQRMHSRMVADGMARRIGGTVDVSLESLDSYSEGKFKGPARIVITMNTLEDAKELSNLEEELLRQKVLRVQDLKESAKRAALLLR